MKSLKPESQVQLLEKIADQHDARAAEAETMGVLPSIAYHESIAKAARALAAAIRAGRRAEPAAAEEDAERAQALRAELAAKLEQANEARERAEAQLDAALTTLKGITGRPEWSVICRVLAERDRQDAAFGPPGTEVLRASHREFHVLAEALARARELVEQDKARGVPTWENLVAEEFYEALCEEDPSRRTAEVIQVAALAVRWALDEDAARLRALSPPAPETPPALQRLGTKWASAISEQSCARLAGVETRVRQDLPPCAITTSSGLREVPCRWRANGLALLEFAPGEFAVTHERSGMNLTGLEQPDAFKALALAMVLLALPIDWTGTQEEIQAAIRGLDPESASILSAVANRQVQLVDMTKPEAEA